MRVTPFTGCCGARILTDFGWTAMNEGERQDDEIPLCEVRAYLKSTINKQETKAFLVAILNKEQNEEIGKVFEEVGFKNVGKGFNDKHPGTSPLTCYLYSFNGCV